MCVAKIFTGELLFGQTQHREVSQGIAEFYEANFEEATATLMDAISEKDLNRTDLFNAYLYLAFSLVRNNAPEEAIEMAFKGSIRINPAYELDVFKIPPDLISRFNSIRSQMVGGLYVVSNPREASVLGVQREENLTIMGKTPIIFEKQLIGEYNLLISKDLYEDKYMNVEIKPATIDTLYITLTQLPKPVHKRWWMWAGGIIVLTILINLMLHKNS
jgi:hypothetical protein